MHRLTLLAVLVVAGLAERPASAAWSRDPSTNQPIATPGQQAVPTTCPDGQGGVYIAWMDNRNGNYDIFAQRLSAKGVPLWTVNGVGVCTETNFQSSPIIVPDGAGGAIIAWGDARSIPGYVGFRDLYAQRVNALGVAQWTPNGVPVCVSGFVRDRFAFIADGAGGAIAAWEDDRTAFDGGDIYIQRVDAAGARLWTTNGIAIGFASGTQERPSLAPDGTGGAFACWTGEFYGVTAQRVNGAGVVQWAAGGIEVETDGPFSPRITSDGSGGCLVGYLRNASSASNDGVWVRKLNSAGSSLWTSHLTGAGVPTPLTTIDFLEITTDGAGGAIVAWSDGRNGSNNRDLFARRVSTSGAPMWTANGVPICTAQGNQDGWNPIVADGTGGAVIAWHDPRVDFVTLDVYAQRVDALGSIQWDPDGKPLSTATTANQSYPMLASDGRNGAVIVWQDARFDANDVYAQRADYANHLGDPAPDIAWVQDLTNDQGERVRIRWNASYRDTSPTLNIEAYGIWRRVTESAATAALARGGRVATAGIAPSAGVFRSVTTAAQTTWWEGVGTVLARGEPWYTFVADTFRDSTALGNPFTTFMVDAHDASTSWFWSSPSDSGYSVDNLPPAVPQAFVSSHQSGATHLDWAANLENDLAAYFVYRGPTPDFVPSATYRIATPTSSEYVDPGPAGSFYKLSAVDIHGNESGFASLTGTTDVGTTMPLEWALEPPRPNPVAGSATIRLALPREGSASLAIYDASGRRVRELLAGAQRAGVQVVPWDLKDDRGAAVAAGLYFVRLDAGGRVLTRRIIAVR